MSSFHVELRLCRRASSGWWLLGCSNVVERARSAISTLLLRCDAVPHGLRLPERMSAAWTTRRGACRLCVGSSLSDSTDTMWWCACTPAEARAGRTERIATDHRPG
jgi:hypothetical protein